jgi:hypothetical protein
MLVLTALTRRFSSSGTMSAPSIASLKRISAKTLSDKLLAESESPEPSIAVIDVRDNGAQSEHPRRVHAS